MKKKKTLFLHVFLRAVLDQNLFDDDSFLYEEVPELLKFRAATPSIELLTDWYQSRAQDIDSCSRQVRTPSGCQHAPAEVIVGRLNLLAPHLSGVQNRQSNIYAHFMPLLFIYHTTISVTFCINS